MHIAYVLTTFHDSLAMVYYAMVYSGALLMWTPLGPTQSVLIKGVSSFQGLFYIHKTCLGPHTVSTLQWMSIFQGCPQGGVPLYWGNLRVGTHLDFRKMTVHRDFVGKSLADRLVVVIYTRVYTQIVKLSEKKICYLPKFASPQKFTDTKVSVYTVCYVRNALMHIAV